MESANKKSGQAGVKSKKELVRVYLENRDTARLLEWSKKERNPLRILTSLLFDEDRLIVWRSIEAIGIISARIAGRDIEKIRRQIQRYLWMMNDESGALCWDAPQAIAEILTQVDPLLEDFAIILPSFLIEEPFEAGTRWGMARLIRQKELPEKIIEHYMSFSGKIIDSLTAPDPETRGNATLLAMSLELEIPEDIRIKLNNDEATFDLYDFETGNLRERKISAVLK